jgi:hypothetical protein
MASVDLGEELKAVPQIALQRAIARAVRLDGSDDTNLPQLYDEAHCYLFDCICSEGEAAPSDVGSSDRRKDELKTSLSAKDLVSSAVLTSLYARRSMEVCQRLGARAGPMAPASASAMAHPFLEEKSLNLQAAALARDYVPLGHEALLIPYAILALLTRTIRHGAFINTTTFVPRAIWEQHSVRIAGFALKKEALAGIMSCSRRFSAYIAKGATTAPDELTRELQIFIDSLGRSRELLKPLLLANDHTLNDARSLAVADAFNSQSGGRAGGGEPQGREHHSDSDVSALDEPPESSAASVTSGGEKQNLNDSIVSDGGAPSRAESPSALSEEGESKDGKESTASTPSAMSAASAPTGSRFSFLKPKSLFGGGSSAPAPAAPAPAAATSGKPPAHPATPKSENAAAEEEAAAKSRPSFLSRAIAGISKSVVKTAAGAASALNLSATATVSVSSTDLTSYALLITNTTDAFFDIQQWLEAATLGLLLEKIAPKPQFSGLDASIADEEKHMRASAQQISMKYVQPSAMRILAFMGEVSQLLLGDVEVLLVRYLQVQADHLRKAEL